MTKAAAEAKGAAAETKEAEKLAASAAKSPKPKDEIALKKGTTGEPTQQAYALWHFCGSAFRWCLRTVAVRVLL